MRKRVEHLRAERVSVKLPITIRFQFNDTAMMLLQGSAADMQKQPFLATITYAGHPSDGCVGGTEDIKDDNGNIIGPMRVMIPVKVMEARVKELIGKAVFAAESLDTHDSGVQVGQFVDAYMERIIGTEVYVVRASGFLDKRNNAELIAKIIDRARTGELGFSYDLKDAPNHIDTSIVQGESILVLDDFKWRGATILRREAAAYYFTNLAAQRAKAAEKASAQSAPLSDASIINPTGGSSAQSPPSGTATEVTEMTIEELNAALAKAIDPLKADLKADVATLKASVETRLAALETAAKPAAAAAAGAPAAAVTAGTTMTLTDITKAMSDAVVAGLKAVGITADAEPGKGKRQTFTAAELQTVKRFNADAVDEKGNVTIEGLTAAIEAVNDRADLTNDAKSRLLGHLVPMKNALIREQMSQGVN